MSQLSSAMLASDILATPDTVSAFAPHQNRQLQQRLKHLEEKTRMLLETATQNNRSQQQIHDLSIRCLNTADLEQLCETLESTLCQAMHVDSVRLLLRSDMRILGRAPLTLGRLSLNEMKALMENYSCRLRTLYEENDRQVHGRMAADIRSDALVSLVDGEGALVGILALGSKRADRFHAGQGSELLSFLGRMLGYVTSRWVSTLPAREAR